MTQLLKISILAFVFSLALAADTNVDSILKPMLQDIHRDSMTFLQQNLLRINPDAEKELTEVINRSSTKLSDLLTNDFLSNLVKSLDGPDSDTNRTKSSVQALSDIKTNTKQITKQLQAAYLSSLTSHSHENRALFKGLSSILVQFNKALNEALDGIVQAVMDKGESSAETKSIAISELSLVPDLEQIKDLFLKALEEIKPEEHGPARKE